MPVNFHLTDEDADIAGYLRAKLGSRSDAPSLVRAVTSTAAGPTAGINATRTAGGTALAWITDPLSGVDLTAAAWTLHLWAKESDAAANAALRFQVFRYATSEAGSAALDSNAGTELSTTTSDVAITTGAATVTALDDGDRLVFRVLFDDAGTMATGYTTTLSYNGQTPRAEGDSYVTCPDNLAVTAALPTATRTRVRRYLKDTDATNPFIADAEIDQAVDAALRVYSRDRPLVVADTRSGDGSTYQFRMPRRWIDGFSHIEGIEYPAGEQAMSLVDENDYRLWRETVGYQPQLYLHFGGFTPASGTDNLLIRYTTRHVHTDELDTVPYDDFDALCWLAASFAADMAAAKMAAAADSTIGADAVDYGNGTDRWRTVAREYRRRYDDHIGAGGGGDGESGGGGGSVPAGAYADWDVLDSGGYNRLFHAGRRR